MPAETKKQQRAMAMALALKKGKLKTSEVGDSVKNMARSMSKKQLGEFAASSKEAMDKLFLDHYIKGS